MAIYFPEYPTHNEVHVASSRVDVVRSYTTTVSEIHLIGNTSIFVYATVDEIYLLIKKDEEMIEILSDYFFSHPYP